MNPGKMKGKKNRGAGENRGPPQGQGGENWEKNTLVKGNGKPPRPKTKKGKRQKRRQKRKNLNGGTGGNDDHKEEGERLGFAKRRGGGRSWPAERKQVREETEAKKKKPGGGWGCRRGKKRDSKNV